MTIARRGARPFVLLGALALMLSAVGCVDDGADDRSARRPASSPAATSPAAIETPASAAPHPVSLRALMEKEFDGGDLRVGRVLLRAGAYTRYFVTYESGGLTISGIMNVPKGNGPFPALVLGHGYIDPDVYTNGRGLRREQDYLARRGYVVLHTDYRSHAQSDDDPKADVSLRLGYTEDVVNAVLALRGSALPYIDTENIGILARSMGGGVALNVAVVRPDLVDAIVLYAPVSSSYVDNFKRWIRGTPERRRLAREIVGSYGSPEENSDFWRNISPVTFFDRVRVPILVHHGTADERVPIKWSRRTVAALRAHDKDVRLITYEGERHAFSFAWTTSMRHTMAFFDARLKTR